MIYRVDYNMYSKFITLPEGTLLTVNPKHIKKCGSERVLINFKTKCSNGPVIAADDYNFVFSVAMYGLIPVNFERYFDVL